MCTAMISSTLTEEIEGFRKRFPYVYIPIIVVRISNPRMREVRRMKMISRPGGVLGETSSVLNIFLFFKTILYAPGGRSL